MSSNPNPHILEDFGNFLTWDDNSVNYNSKSYIWKHISILQGERKIFNQNICFRLLLQVQTLTCTMKIILRYHLCKIQNIMAFKHIFHMNKGHLIFTCSEIASHNQTQITKFSNPSKSFFLKVKFSFLKLKSKTWCNWKTLQILSLSNTRYKASINRWPTTLIEPPRCHSYRYQPSVPDIHFSNWMIPDQ